MPLRFCLLMLAREAPSVVRRGMGLTIDTIRDCSTDVVEGEALGKPALTTDSLGLGVHGTSRPRKGRREL